MFKNLSIKMKLLLTVILVILSISIIMEINSIYSLKKDADLLISNTEKIIFESKNKEVKNYVSLAYKTAETYYERTAKDKIQKEVESYLKEHTDSLFTIINSIYEKNKNKISNEEMFKKIKDVISANRYGKSGYFFGYNPEGICLILPTKPKLEGKNLSHIKDKNGVFVIKEVVKAGLSKQNSGYVSYLWDKPGFNQPQLKVSYAKMFKPLNIIIGTGAYVDDISAKMKEEALNAISKMRYGKSGYFWVNDSKHVVIAHGDKKSLVGKDLTNMKDKKGKYLYQEVVKTALANKEGGLVNYYWSKPNEEGTFRKISYVKRFEPWDLIIGTGTYVTDIDKEIQDMKKESEDGITKEIYSSIIIMGLTILFISIILIFVLNKIIIKPLKTFQDGVLDFFKYLNKEEDKAELINMNSQDELGIMASVVNDNIKKTQTLIEQDNQLITDVSNIVQHIKEGHLDTRVQSNTSNEALQTLKEQLNEMLDNLEKNIGSNINNILAVLNEYGKLDFRKSISNANGNVEIAINNLAKIINKMLQDNQKNGLDLSSSSQSLLDDVDNLNQASTEAAASLEETAAALEEITGNIQNNTNNIIQMSNYANEVTEGSIQGEKLASKTTQSMEEINEQVTAINEAIAVIDQIAFQTNILSLNAAVEAATAGEAGKGFAVVAQEVRNLASRSAEAAKEIKDIVEHAKIKADEGKLISEEMINGYEGLNDSIKNTINLIKDIEMASKEQQTGIEQINDAINQLDQQTQANVATANNTQQIAENTNNISIKIINDVNEKEFIGKS